MISSNYSFSSCKHISELFKEMFKDSDIAYKFQMAKTKSTYLISFGIAEYCKEVMMRDMKDCAFAYSFDETGTIQKKQQYDCYVRYNSTILKRVVTRFISSEFLGHCRADDLFNIFFKKLSDYQLNIDNLVHIQSDFPNVNKSFLTKVTSKIKKDNNKELALTQSCVLHPVHTYFNKALSNIHFDYVEFIQDLYSFFKRSPARIEDFHL